MSLTNVPSRWCNNMFSESGSPFLMEYNISEMFQYCFQWSFSNNHKFRSIISVSFFSNSFTKSFHLEVDDIIGCFFFFCNVALPVELPMCYLQTCTKDHDDKEIPLKWLESVSVSVFFWFFPSFFIDFVAEKSSLFVAL